jgi:hypothetical protein
MSGDYLKVDHYMAGPLICQVIVTSPAQVRVDWGDGSPVQTVGATSSTPHTYAKAGNYRVHVTGHSGLHSGFAVVAGSPLPAWDASNVADKLQGPKDDLAAIVGTTGVVG